MSKFLFLLLFIITTVCIDAQTYNHYYGNIHAHSSYSDGNKDSSTSLLTKPLQDFNYAKNAQHVDFYGISEHNHFSAGMTNPINYHRGLADADSANVDSVFVALYGMEWGVISSGGHVLIYGYDSLIGWDTHNYDVYVAEGDYTSLWKKINEKPGAFAYLAHPQASDYNNLYTSSANLSADNAIVGTAARSGPAFSTNTSYSNPSTSNYINRYNDALRRGYHLGVGLDHDTHNTVFGQQTAGRMVVLAPALTRSNILDAIRHMRFYSSDDWNVKVDFTIKNQPMGSSLTHTGVPTILVSVTDPDVGETVSSIAVYYGVPGSGSNPTTLTSASNTSTLSYTHNIANNSTYYYYVRITQNDGNIIWTSPIWYKRNDAITNNPPVADFTIPPTVCVGQPVTFNDITTNAPSDWSWSLHGALPDTSNNQSVIATYYTPGTYTISLNTSNAFGASAAKSATITVFPLPVVSVLSDTICRGETASLTASGASTYSWSSGSIGTTAYVTPTLSTLYTVTGTVDGCSANANTFVIVQSCVGVNQLYRGLFKIYPNPANQFLTVELTQQLGEKTIELYDALGNLVISTKGTESLQKFDLSFLTGGIYLVKVVLNDKLYAIEKFIIEQK